MFQADTPDRWRNTERVVAAATHLIDTLRQRHPTAHAAADTDPYTALAAVSDLNVIRDNSARNPTCPVDGTYNPATSTIRYRETGNPARDHFTLLHELGHHLLAINEDWSYDVAPMLKEANLDKYVEERIVNAFASMLLIPDDLARNAFRNGVTATAARDLYLNSNASATACLARCLLEPDHRMVMLATGHGTVWYAQSTGEPYAPSAQVEQPTIAYGAQRAHASDGHAHFTGHEGIRYRTGSTNTNVVWDIAVHDTLVFAVVEPTPTDNRLSNAPSTWDLNCLAGCGHTFPPAEAAGTCNTCRQHKCARCRGCECRNDSYCTRCTIALPTSYAAAGKTLCDECE